jgi:hypothetical protein
MSYISPNNVISETIVYIALVFISILSDDVSIVPTRILGFGFMYLLIYPWSIIFSIKLLIMDHKDKSLEFVLTLAFISALFSMINTTISMITSFWEVGESIANEPQEYNGKRLIFSIIVGLSCFLFIET